MLQGIADGRPRTPYSKKMQNIVWCCVLNKHRIFEPVSQVCGVRMYMCECACACVFVCVCMCVRVGLLMPLTLCSCLSYIGRVEHSHREPYWRYLILGLRYLSWNHILFYTQTSIEHLVLWSVILPHTTNLIRTSGQIALLKEFIVSINTLGIAHSW